MLATELNCQTLHAINKWLKEEEMGKKSTFGSVAEFLTWAGHQKITLGIKGSEGWKLIIEEDEVRLESSFYNVEATAPYGAFKAIGHLVQIGDEEVSGIVEFGFDEEGVFGIVNRRRCVASDSEKNLVNIIEAALDRLNEPVAVVVSSEDIEKISQFSAEEWLNLFDRCRDGVELMATREVMKAVE